MQKNFLILLSALTLLFPVESFSQNSVIPAGTDIQVRLTERLDSDTNRSGQTFEALLDVDLTANGRLVARAGNLVKGRLVEVIDSGRVKGRARMTLTLTEIQTVDGTFPIETNNVVVEASGSAKRDAAVVGGTAVLGAIIGAIAGGKSGAGLGAVIGAAGGTGAVLVTEGKDVEFEPEQKFNFVLARDLRTDSFQSSASPYGYGRETDRTRRGYGRGQARTEDANQIEDIARNLREAADRAYNSLQARQRTSGGNLAMSLSNFANSARLYSDSVGNSQQGGLRSGARNLIAQAERIDTYMTRLPENSQLRSDWMEVQNEVSRLSSALNLPYASGRRLAARDPYPYDTSPYSDTGRGYFRWQGQVDGTDHIILQGNRVSIRHLQSARIVDPSYDLRAALPRYPVTVELTRLRGRGDVEILEQPSARNNYTVTVLVEDRDRGSDFYEFELTWQPRN
jgi:hypothetical protein